MKSRRYSGMLLKVCLFVDALRKRMLTRAKQTTLKEKFSYEDGARRFDLDGNFLTFASVAVADQSDGFVAALRVDLLHDPVDVILDGEFGQIQICGDFLVAQAHGD
jgi:hypothetical protein